MKKILTIIIPAFNVEKYVRMSVESALKSLDAACISQYEIIIVNDGSTDGTYDIVKSIQKINNKITLINKSNGGYGSAINAGLSRANSKYISILDSDDVCIAGAYEAAISALEQDPKIDLTRHPYIEWQNGKLQKSVGIPNPSPQIQTAVENPQLLYMAPAIWSAVYRLSFLKANNITVLETPGASYQDTYFAACAMLSDAKIKWLAKPAVAYRTDRVGASRQSSTRTSEILNIFKEIHNFLEASGRASDQRLGLLYASMLLRIRWIAPRLSVSYVPIFFITLNSLFKTISSNPSMFYHFNLFIRQEDKKLLEFILTGNYENFRKECGLTRY